MPNHITNRITSSDPSVLARIAEALKSDKSGVDFNKLVPTPDDVFQGDLTMEKQAETRGRNWYDWNCANWGTKWNAYQVSITPEAIKFDTAWSHPAPIVAALAKVVEGPWTWDYADEDLGSNCARLQCASGEVSAWRPSYPEAFACAVLGREAAAFEFEEVGDDS